MLSGELTVTGVGIRQYRAVGIGCSLGSALLPGEIPPGAVVVVCGIADDIVSEVFAVHCGEQVSPGAVVGIIAVALNIVSPEGFIVQQFPSIDNCDRSKFLVTAD